MYVTSSSKSYLMTDQTVSS